MGIILGLNVVVLIVQLNTKEAFELCRYEWMRKALEAFLEVMVDDRKMGMEEEKPELDSNPVSELGECQIMPPKSCIDGMSGINTFSWQIALKRLPPT